MLLCLYEEVMRRLDRQIMLDLKSATFLSNPDVDEPSLNQRSRDTVVGNSGILLFLYERVSKMARSSKLVIKILPRLAKHTRTHRP